MTMRLRLAHRVGRSSQATPAAVDKSSKGLTHRNPDAPTRTATLHAQGIAKLRRSWIYRA